MKNLLIIRHAESDWNSPDGSDRNRPLTEQGEIDAPLMGKRLHDQGLAPDRILCSPARRALATAHAVASQTGYDANNIDVHETLYMQDRSDLMLLLKNLPIHWQRVYLVGHNPDVEWMVSHLTGGNFKSIRPCGIASIEFDLPAWEHIMAGSGRLAFFDHPRLHLPLF